MEEKVRILMEEINCEQGEAELALELAGNNLESAIRTIESLLKNIVAIKGKFYSSETNLYGLFIVIFNSKTQQILRSGTVVSYNPTVFENSPDMDWYAFEKLVFSSRLDKGSIPDFTREIEQKLENYLAEIKQSLTNSSPENLIALMKNFFVEQKFELKLGIEELNLAQFRQLPSASTTKIAASSDIGVEPGTISLQIDLIEDENGKQALNLEENDMVYSKIIDSRDIAHYLAHLIGGQAEGNVIPVPVRKVDGKEGGLEIHLQYAPGIVGVVKVDSKMRVKILDAKGQLPWWKRLLPWG
jgi:hypothetical protein